jgi:TonB dependent receptor.
MFRTPNSYGYLTSTITPIKHFSASISGTYTGSMLVQHHIGSGVNKDVAVNTPDFVDVNLKLSYEFPLYDEVKLELSGGIQNLFNAYQKDF